MKPINTGGHAGYQTKMMSLLKQYYPDAFSRFGPSLWDTIGKFYSMDLSAVDELMADRYSIFGPPPRLPSDMLRSYMLSLVMKITSVTTWSEVLKTNPIAAIVSGFNPDDTPMALHISKRIITLPLFADLKEDIVDKICDIILA